MQPFASDDPRQSRRDESCERSAYPTILDGRLKPPALVDCPWTSVPMMESSFADNKRLPCIAGASVRFVRNFGVVASDCWPNAPIAEPRPNGRCQRNGCWIRRAPDREESTAADELCPIERPETGRLEIEQRGLTALRMLEGDRGRATLGEPEPRSQPIGPQSRPDWRSMPYAASTARRRCFPVKLQTRAVPQQPTMPLNDADPFAPFALPQVQCQSSTPACCVPVIATCASI